MDRSKTARWRWHDVRATGAGAFLVVLAAVAVTAGAQVYAVLEGAEFDELSRDAAAVLDGPNYTGYYATFTVLVWASAAAIALFSSLVLRSSGDRSGFRFLLAVGLLTGFMAADDAFLIHETVGYRLGDNEELFFVAYGLATLAIAWRFRRRLGPGLLLLGAAFACWIASAGIDVVLKVDAPFIVEDGLKLVGVALWSFLLVRTSLAEVSAARRPQPVEPAAPPAAVAEPVAAAVVEAPVEVPTPAADPTDRLVVVAPRAAAGGPVDEVTVPVAPHRHRRPDAVPPPRGPRHSGAPPGGPQRRGGPAPQAGPVPDRDSTTPVAIVAPRHQRHDDVPAARPVHHRSTR